jgi:murein DD-endopeptidase MepM/ murein hydrolase activator NlpD
LLRIQLVRTPLGNREALPRRLRFTTRTSVLLMAGVVVAPLALGWLLREQALSSQQRQREAMLQQETRRLRREVRLVQNFRSEYLQLRSTLHKLGGETNNQASQGGPLQFGQLTAELSQLNSKGNTSLQRLPLGPPILGAYRLTSRFGLRRDPIWGVSSGHQGLDLAASIGTPIAAAGEGKVLACSNSDGYGLQLQFAHSSSLITRYAHLDSCRVRAGQRVAKGEWIATVGNSGRSTGPHLHYEVLLRQQLVDPEPFLRGQPFS